MPRLVETKHIKHRLLRVGNGALFCSLKYISSTLRFAPEGLFFCRRAVWSGGFFHFTFPWPGGCGSSTKTQKGAKYGPQTYESRHRRNHRFRSYAQPHFTGLCAGFSLTGGATSSLPVWRRIAGSGDAAPPGTAAKRPMTKTKTPHEDFKTPHVRKAWAA